MEKKELYSISEKLYKKIQEDRKKKESETKAYFDGMEKGADMMTNAIRDYLNIEALKGGVE